MTDVELLLMLAIEKSSEMPGVTSGVGSQETGCLDSVEVISFDVH